VPTSPPPSVTLPWRAGLLAPSSSVHDSPAHMAVAMSRPRLVALAVLVAAVVLLDHLNARYHISITPRSRHERLKVVGPGETAIASGRGVGVGATTPTEQDTATADEVAALRAQLHDARAALATAKVESNTKMRAKIAEARRGCRRGEARRRSWLAGSGGVGGRGGSDGGGGSGVRRGGNAPTEKRVQVWVRVRRRVWLSRGRGLAMVGRPRRRRIMSSL